MIDRELKHIVPEEIDSKTKIGHFFTAGDITILGIPFLLSHLVKPYVHSGFHLLLTLFSLFLGLILIMPSKSNGDKKMYHTIFYILLKRRRFYYSSDNPYEEELDLLELPTERNEHNSG